MNKLKISILLMLYDAGEKGLTDKQIADRLDINKKGFKKLETALSEMKQHNDIAYKKGMCWIKHPEQFFKAARRYAGRVFRARPRPHGVYSRRYRACKADRRS